MIFMRSQTIKKIKNKKCVIYIYIYIRLFNKLSILII